MRELTKSALTLPWALSMFGVQQATNLVAPSTDRMADAAAAFDKVSDVTEQQLDGWLKQAQSVGNGVNRALVDLMMMKAPEIDSSTLMRMANEPETRGAFRAIVKYGMPPVGWLDSFLVARKDSPAVDQEFTNKLYIITMVTQVHALMGLDAETVEPVPTLVDRAGDMETFPRVWIVEGIGNWIGDDALEKSEGVDPVGLLTGPDTASVPPWSLTMLHAGIGMSFAKDILKRLTPDSPSDVVRPQIRRFVSLCRNSSRPGYTGAALESLGLATRTLYPNMVNLIDREIPGAEPDIHGYFWHGAGRAMYFHPINMLPSVNAPWRAIRKLDEEAPHDLARRNALSGIAWALTVVNMRHPIVMEAFLRHHGALAAQNDAFTNGVTSSLLMRYDTTRDDSHISPFLHYEPKGEDPAVASAWRNLITTPCEKALRQTYSELTKGPKLEELFHYRPQSA
ncbi:MAG: hypothetical protein ACHQO8_10340 [Vicinamibacterales bacterium]